MRRPLLVSHTGAPGGSNEVLLALLEQHPTDVTPACVFLAGGETAERTRALGIDTEVLTAGRAREVWRAPGVIRALRRMMRHHRADLVFAHNSKAQFYAAIAARAENLPSLWWQHALPGRQRTLDAVAERLPTVGVICASDFTASLQRQRTPRVPVHRVHGGVPVPPDPGNAPLVEGRIGLVGRLQRWKRVELLLNAVPLVVAAEPQITFKIVGGGDPSIDPGYPEELRELSRRLGIEDTVTFTGHISGPGELIAHLDVLVHTADREPFGLVYLEAMARRVPVVAPSVGGSTEIVRDGVDGLLVDVCDAEALAQALLTLLSDPERRRRMGAAGRERVQALFTLERMTAETWRVASEAAGSFPAVRRR